ncbi:hypothetical protein HDK77DRAFT_458715 [Phyllosticta capitalensis]
MKRQAAGRYLASTHARCVRSRCGRPVAETKMANDEVCCLWASSFLFSLFLLTLSPFSASSPPCSPFHLCRLVCCAVLSYGTVSSSVVRQGFEKGSYFTISMSRDMTLIFGGMTVVGVDVKHFYVCVRVSIDSLFEWFECFECLLYESSMLCEMLVFLSLWSRRLVFFCLRSSNRAMFFLQSHTLSSFGVSQRGRVFLSVSCSPFFANGCGAVSMLVRWRASGLQKA